MNVAELVRYAAEFHEMGAPDPAMGEPLRAAVRFWYDVARSLAPDETAVIVVG